MTQRVCPICGSGAETARPFLAERTDPSKLTATSYASRKEPERLWRRMVLCLRCDLVYADLPPTQDDLAREYHKAAYDSATEAEDAAYTYDDALARVITGLPRAEAALEIGTGTGAFLERLHDRGFTTLVGIEPSSAAIAAAPAQRRPWIREGIFRPEDYADGSFDLVCCFMTLEHVLNPNDVARSAMRLLRPGGAFAVVTHDYRALVNRILGTRSPIVDIEHLQLFSQKSLRELFERTGFQDVSVRPIVNRYRWSYWVRLAPLPKVLKRPVASAIARSGMKDRHLALGVGNVVAVGVK